jgi:hypothetical protein
MLVDMEVAALGDKSFKPQLGYDWYRSTRMDPREFYGKSGQRKGPTGYDLEKKVVEMRNAIQDKKFRSNIRVDKDWRKAQKMVTGLLNEMKIEKEVLEQAGLAVPTPAQFTKRLVADIKKAKLPVPAKKMAVLTRFVQTVLKGL